MARRRIAPVAWAAVAVGSLVLVALAVILFAAAVDLSGAKGLSNGERASVLQAFAAAGALAGTAALIGVTAYYAWVTAKMLERGGPMIDVELKQAWVHVTGGGAITVPLDRGLQSSPLDPEYPRFMFAIEVRNTGGAAATVDKAAVEAEKGIQYWQPVPIIGPGFPHRLEPHSAVTFFVEPHPVGVAVEVFKLKPEVRAIVVLASGPVYRTAKVRLDQTAP